MSTADKIPPQSLEAEMAVIGSVLLDREMLPVAMAHVKAADFYAHVHETIWTHILALYETDAPIDKITLAERLRSAGMLEKTGGLAYLNSLLEIVPTASSVEYYAAIVADKAGSRAIIRVARELYEKAYNEHFETSADLQDYALGEITRALASNAIPVTSLDEVVDGVVARIGSPSVRPLLSQWETLDRLTGGFKPGELIVWGAAPGMGKSIMLGNYAEYTAHAYQPKGFALFSLEMTQEDSAERILSMRAGVPVNKIREGVRLTSEDWRALEYAQRALKGIPIEFITRHPRRSLADVKRASRAIAQKRGGLSGIAIDHIGFVSDLASASEKSGGKHAALDRLLGELLSLADELSCPVHVVYHLNRGAKAARPTMFDLRDGGNTEGHATTIIFPWRPNPGNDPEVVDDAGNPIPPTRAEVSVAKCRHGVPGTVAMHFDGVESLWLEATDQLPWFEKGYDVG
jgi:replicative DNA helicase